MKFLLTIIIFFATPIIFTIFLLSAVIPLIMQYFFRSKTVRSNTVYPYQTSWEEAA